MRLWIVATVFALTGCRFNFDAQDTAHDASVLDSPDYRDAPLAAFCTPLGVVVTAEQCAAAFADPAAASDQLLYDCADACALHGCILFEGDADGCSGCACTAYIKSNVICDMGGLCGPPLNGTGCIVAGGNTGPPWNCPAGVTIQETMACELRVLIALGDC